MPTVGEERVVRRFVWFPRRLNNEWRWFQWAWVRQEWISATRLGDAPPIIDVAYWNWIAWVDDPGGTVGHELRVDET